MRLSNAPSSSFAPRTADDKLPHDASVFVGSLPSNIDQGDLTRMLMEHLSEHTQIKNIKVVRDSKGGVCAFVQCENALSANALIQALHSSAPRPFLGRILRYEPARAFRSLVISYRTPTRFMTSPDADAHVSMPTSACGEVELKLPYAMRIWKHRNSRFHNISYNSEAVQSEENHDCMAGVSLLDNVLFLNPLKFDEQALRVIASYFGPLEKFCLLDCSGTDDAKPNPSAPSEAVDSYPEPHCAPRSFSMDPSCWEIKWEHRDDCVSALMTLKRVPHLTVTWAHQPSSLLQTSRSYPQQIFGHPPWSLPSHQSPSSAPSEGLRKHPIFKQPVEGEKCISPSTDDVIADQGLSSPVERGNELSSGNARSIPRPPSRAMKDLSQAVISERQSLSNCSVLRNDSSERPNINRFTDSGTQELYIPQTPTLDSSTVTPLTPGSHFPLTPTSSGAELHQDMLYKNFDLEETSMSFGESRSGREIDPTTLFVGGLEVSGPGGWDEEKVRLVFSRFGGLESVKLVRPLNASVAFAFVKFDNAEAPARAVFEEHSRVYAGRAIRVQLRDCNPPKNNWKYGRGRGRLHQHQFGPARRSCYRSSFNADEPQIPWHIPNNDRTALGDSQAVSEIQLSSLADALPALDRTTEDSFSSSAEKLSSSSETRAPERYREWYENSDCPTQTPEPSPMASSISTTNLSFSSSPYNYPVPNGQYLPPPPWMHPYSPHGPYQLPYYHGYPVYPSTGPQQPHAPATTPPSSDVANPMTPVQPHWPAVGMYASYIPYPSTASQGQLQTPQMNPQAPVVPTGFIQNEQGTLIAVYQPEALDQYLAGSRQRQAPVPQYSSSNQIRKDGNPPFAPTLNQFKASPSQQFSGHKRENRRPFHGTAPFLYQQGGDRRENYRGVSSVRQPRPFNNGYSNRGQKHQPGQVYANPRYQISQPNIPYAW